MTGAPKDYPVDDTPHATSPAPQRWLAVLVVLAVVCAIVMVMG